MMVSDWIYVPNNSTQAGISHFLVFANGFPISNITQKVTDIGEQISPQVHYVLPEGSCGTKVLVRIKAGNICGFESKMSANFTALYKDSRTVNHLTCDKMIFEINHNGAANTNCKLHYILGYI